jgi:hypothetical protein
VIETIMHELIHGSLRKETAVFTIMGFVPYPCHSISLFPQSFGTSFPYSMISIVFLPFHQRCNSIHTCIEVSTSHTALKPNQVCRHLFEVLFVSHSTQYGLTGAYVLSNSSHTIRTAHNTFETVFKELE